jgi:hypothetical protein
MRRLLMAAALLLTVASVAAAQLGGGSISGTVSDHQGAVLPGVTVTLAGSDRSASVVTDEAGRFRFLNLAPGAYTVTVAFQGFTTVKREGIEVRVGANADLPIRMGLAAVEETVTVTGESPIIDVKSTSTATNFTSRRPAMRLRRAPEEWA